MSNQTGTCCTACCTTCSTSTSTSIHTACCSPAVPLPHLTYLFARGGLRFASGGCRSSTPPRSSLLARGRSILSEASFWERQTNHRGRRRRRWRRPVAVLVGHRHLPINLRARPRTATTIATWPRPPRPVPVASASRRTPGPPFEEESSQFMLCILNVRRGGP